MESQNLESLNYYYRHTLERGRHIIQVVSVILIAVIYYFCHSHPLKNPGQLSMILIDLLIISICYISVEFNNKSWVWLVFCILISTNQNFILMSSNYDGNWINMMELLSDYSLNIRPKIGVYWTGRICLVTHMLWRIERIKVPNFHSNQLGRVVKFVVSSFVMVVHIKIVKFIEKQCDIVNLSQIHKENFSFRQCVDERIMSNYAETPLEEIIKSCNNGSLKTLGSISECFSNVDHVNYLMGTYTLLLTIILMVLTQDLTKSSWSGIIRNHVTRNNLLTVSIIMTLTLVTINPTNGHTLGGMIHQIVALFMFAIFPVFLTILVHFITWNDVRSKNIINMFIILECICCLSNLVMFGMGNGYSFEVGVMKHSINLFIFCYVRLV
jgi:hypothetical protein